MKVNVHGLVFVGFAAAILAGAAHAAGENIVTSKAYTDATYEKLADKVDSIDGVAAADKTTKYPSVAALEAAIESVSPTSGDSFELTSHKLSGASGSTIGGTAAGNGAGQDQTMYPSAAAVKEYVADQLSDGNTPGSGYQHTSTEDFQVGGANGTWKTVTNGTYTTAGTDGNGGFKVDVNALNGTGTGNFANVSGGTGEDTNKLPTAAAVKAYVDSKATSDLNGKQDKVAGTTGVAMVGHGDGEWLPVEDTTYAELTRVQDPNDASKYVMRVAVKDTKIANHGVTDSNAGTTNEIVASSDKLTTANAVAEYVTDQLANGGTNQNGYQEKSDANYQIGNSTGTWDTMGNGAYTTWARNASTGAVTVDVNAETAAAGVTTGATTIPTSGAVADAIAAATGSNTIPQKNPEVCTASYPCALVAEGSNLNWRVMAVGGNQPATGAGSAGYCGNVGGNCPTGA